MGPGPGLGRWVVLPTPENGEVWLLTGKVGASGVRRIWGWAGRTNTSSPLVRRDA